MNRQITLAASLFLSLGVQAQHLHADGYRDKPEIVSQQKRIDTLVRLHGAKLISDALYERSLRKLNNHPISVDSSLSRSVTTNQSEPNPPTGRFVALIIGNNQYDHFESLETAINDAEAINTVLYKKYQFEVQLLKNVTRREVFIALAHWQENLTSNDSFLLYYAGHGYLDPATNRGYWLPTDADRHNQSNWISTNDISDALLAIPANRALVIADSCFSGSLADTSVRPAYGVSSTNKNLAGRSRTVITSGGLEPVLDSIDGQHSVFARALLNQLNETKDTPKISELFKQVSFEVNQQANQSPGYYAINGAGHQLGEFIFPAAK